MKLEVFRKTKMAVIGLMAGASMFAVGSCTSDAVKTQFSKGLTTALNGVFNISSSNLANQVFDVDD